MSYQKSKAIRSRSLSGLIVDRTLQGRGFGTSIVSSIKDKTIASAKGLTEKFDPLNIATAFGGRLGGYAFGKLTGRSQEDISYFTGASGRGSFVDSRKNKNPLVSKVGANENRPTKKGDGLADIMARIFNLIKKNAEQVKKKQEITANFEEGKEEGRELRHKELLEAISKIRRRTATPVETKKEEKGLFSRLLESVKNMIEKAMKAIKPVLDFVKSIMKALGSKTLKFLQFLAALGTESVLSFLLPVGIATALLYLASEHENRIEEINKNPNDPKFKDVPLAMVARGLAANESEAININRRKSERRVSRNYIQDLVNSKATDELILKNTGASREDLQKWLKRTEKEPNPFFQQSVRNDAGNIVIKAGDPRDNLEVIPSVRQTPRQRGFQPGGSEPTKVRNIEPTPQYRNPYDVHRGTTTPQINDKVSYVPPEIEKTNSGGTSYVTQTPGVNPVTTKLAMAQNLNSDLNLDETSSSEPIIIDKSKVLAGGDSGGIHIFKSASVRIFNPTLKGVQDQSLRSFA